MVPIAVVDPPDVVMQKLNDNVLPYVKDTIIQQFIMSRARRVCRKHHRDQLTYVTCLKHTMISGVNIARRYEESARSDDITHTSTEMQKKLLEVENEDLRKFILLRSQTDCDELQLEAEKEKCLRTNILFDVNVATGKRDDEELGKRMVGKKMLRGGRKVLSLTS
jgi:hypothetical protein